jgi:hypothetical protein
MVSLADPGHLGTAQKRTHTDDMPNVIQETSYRLSPKIRFAAGWAEQFLGPCYNSFCQQL